MPMHAFISLWVWRFQVIMAESLQRITQQAGHEMPKAAGTQRHWQDGADGDRVGLAHEGGSPESQDLAPTPDLADHRPDHGPANMHAPGPVIYLSAESDAAGGLRRRQAPSDTVTPLPTLPATTVTVLPQTTSTLDPVLQARFDAFVQWLRHHCQFVLFLYSYPPEPPPSS